MRKCPLICAQKIETQTQNNVGYILAGLFIALIYCSSAESNKLQYIIYNQQCQTAAQQSRGRWG